MSQNLGRSSASTAFVGDDGTVELRPGIGVEDAELAAFARRHGIGKLSLFGSALGDDFGPESDLDLLVDFLPGRTPGLFAIAEMEIELTQVLGREVDLRTAADLSRYFRDRVQSEARELYAA